MSGVAGAERSGADLLERVLELAQRARVLLDAEGLTIRRYRALRALSGGPLRVGELARAIEVRGPTAVTLVQRLAEEGFVEREPDPTDQRATVLRLSERGLARLDEAHDRLLEEFDRIARASSRALL
jgi:DNA-binding MarR family transcriptional regulator